MNIQDIENKKIIIGKTSIAVKDENGKTCGIVRNVVKFMDLQPNKTSAYFTTVKNAGLWGRNDDTMQRVVYVDGSLYYLHNLTHDKNYLKYYADHADEFPRETEKYKQRQTLIKQAGVYMNVVQVYL